MKAHLLFRDHDFDMRRASPWNEKEVNSDLALAPLLKSMAGEEQVILDVSQKVILSGFENDLDTIHYRQSVLRDCLKNAVVVREIYGIAVEAKERQKKRFFFGSLSHRPQWVLRESIELLEIFLALVKKLREIADSRSGQFASDGWKNFFSLLQRELSDEYFARARLHLEQLRFEGGILLSARLGTGNKGMNFVLHPLPYQRGGLWERLKLILKEYVRPFFPGQPFLSDSEDQPVFTYSVHPRDESGARSLEELRDRSLGPVAEVLAQARDHLRAFFVMLETELAFYVGCINLHDELTRKGVPTCFPVPAAHDARRLSFRGLYDASLALTMKGRVVGNDANADGRDIVIVTGANQGGKSTFLRSLGLAQLMTQCGMFAPAEAFSSSLYDHLFTHYKREEDVSMKSGKLDEELHRMSEIMDHITPQSFVLFNESFAATNEREGSEIATQIVAALLERGVRIGFVTHLYEFASGFSARTGANALFLRAERRPDGTRTFKLTEGDPLETSFGEDLYRKIFQEGPKAESKPG